MRPKILIIDDEPDIRTLVNLILTGAGYQVLMAPNGRQGLQTLDDQAVDLVLLDIMLPDIDGWDVCRQLRAKPETAGIPVLFFTVRNRALENTQREWNLADGYLPKPFEPQELVETIEQFTLARAC